MGQMDGCYYGILKKILKKTKKKQGAFICRSKMWVLFPHCILNPTTETKAGCFTGRYSWANVHRLDRADCSGAGLHFAEWKIVPRVSPWKTMKFNEQPTNEGWSQKTWRQNGHIGRRKSQKQKVCRSSSSFLSSQPGGNTIPPKKNGTHCPLYTCR